MIHNLIVDYVCIVVLLDISVASPLSRESGRVSSMWKVKGVEVYALLEAKSTGKCTYSAVYNIG